MYLITSFVYFLLAGIMALLIRIQLLSPTSNFLSDQIYNELFTMHGTIMLLLFATPLFIGFANELVPLQIGAPDVAFPRLNLLSYYLFAFGGLILFASFLAPGGSAAFGWYAYSPLTSAANSPGVGADMWIMGLALSGFGTILGARQLRHHDLLHARAGHDDVPDADLHLERAAHLDPGAARVPGAGRRAAGARGRPPPGRPGLLRQQRRRDPLAEPVLVLRPSGGLYSGVAVLRHRDRDPAGVQPQAAVRLQDADRGDDRDRRPVDDRVGAPHVHHRRGAAAVLLVHDAADRGADRA